MGEGYNNESWSETAHGSPKGSVGGCPFSGHHRKGASAEEPSKNATAEAPLKKRAPVIHYVGDGVRAEGRAGETLLEVSLRSKVPHIWECGGKAKCTTCRVRVLDGLGNTTAPTGAERAMARLRGWDEHTRLACQLKPQGDMVVERLVRNAGESSRSMADELELEPGREKSLAILFCDLRNFTPISEHFMAYDVVHILNRYFESIGEAVIYNDGYIYQYAGDALVAWFGLHGGDPREHCTNAVRAGLGMQAILEEVNKGLQEEFGLSLRTSIGVHYGPVILGRIGHSSHKQLAAVGDSVNVAARIEEKNRCLGTKFLISEKVRDLLGEELSVRSMGEIPLKGKQEPVNLFEVRKFANPDALLLVQNTFERILGDPEEFGRRFYDRLFEAAPELKKLFNGDLNAQVRMFMEMLRYVLHSINRFDEVGEGLRESGRRHVAYGVKDHHCDIVAKAFSATLRETLVDDVDGQVIAAWEGVMGRITDAIRAGMRQAHARRAPHIPPPATERAHSA